MEQRVVGQTKSVGFQVGVRRTLPVSQERAWELVTSAQGLQLWLGEATDISLRPGQRYETKTGESGEIRIVKPLQQLRLTWQKPDWQRASTVQVRILPKAGGKTTISFHQEHLVDKHVREEMKARWEAVLEEMGKRVI
ncbi:SRPBCC family protein [Brevibacillus sp. B_LB10_24]|uniref:SRPBCC family protein n=1 Tax=Brevibacillus sp. B_LB10_24 TaxID=3380645 RepID=UPI0038BA696D